MSLILPDEDGTLPSKGIFGAVPNLEGTLLRAASSNFNPFTIAQTQCGRTDLTDFSIITSKSLPDEDGTLVPNLEGTLLCVKGGLTLNRAILPRPLN